MNIEAAALAYQQQAQESEEARAYYESYGLDVTAMHRHRLGWITEPASSTHERYVSMPVVPYLSADQQVIQLRVSPFENDLVGRPDLLVIESRFPLVEPPLRLYNVGHTLPGLRTRRVHLTHDVQSVLLLRAAGHRAVGVPGWDNWHPSWNQLLSHADVVVHHVQDDETVAEVLGQFKKARIDHEARPIPEGHRTIGEWMLATGETP